MNQRKTKVFAGISVIVLLITACQEDNDSAAYPDGDITLVIPYEPGGATDVVFRATIPYLEDELDINVIPQNIPGASASTGSQEVLEADPDGYTVLGTHETLIQTNLAGVTDYSISEFEHVALLTETPVIAGVNSDTGWDNLDDLAEAIDSGEEITWGITRGSTSHFFTEMMLNTLDAPSDSLNYIDYVGTADAIAALQSGEIDGTYTDIASSQSQFDSGEFTPLGVADEERTDELPEAATFEEQGYDLVYTSARGVFAPSETPQDVVDTLSSALENVVENDGFQEQVADVGTNPSYLNPEDHESFMVDLEGQFTDIAQDMEFED